MKNLLKINDLIVTTYFWLCFFMLSVIADSFIKNNWIILYHNARIMSILKMFENSMFLLVFININDKIKVTKKGKIKITKIGYFFDVQ